MVSIGPLAPPRGVGSMVGTGVISGEQLPRGLSWFLRTLCSWPTCCLELPQSFQGGEGAL